MAVECYASGKVKCEAYDVVQDLTLARHTRNDPWRKQGKAWTYRRNHSRRAAVTTTHRRRRHPQSRASPQAQGQTTLWSIGQPDCSLEQVRQCDALEEGDEAERDSFKHILKFSFSYVLLAWVEERLVYTFHFVTIQQTLNRSSLPCLAGSPRFHCLRICQTTELHTGEMIFTSPGRKLSCSSSIGLPFVVAPNDQT